MSTLSDETLMEDKSTIRDVSQIEPVRTISRVPGNSNYYEKNGLRTEGDGVDHSLYHPVSIPKSNLSRLLIIDRARWLSS